ncbi:hypothetical protein J6590_105170, partial [Homalodisca vitripennis]
RDVELPLAARHRLSSQTQSSAADGRERPLGHMVGLRCPQDLFTDAVREWFSSTSCVAFCGVAPSDIKLFLHATSMWVDINKQTNNEQKEVTKGKKRVQTYPKAVWSPVQALSLHRMQVTSTNHKYEDHNHTSHQHRVKWDTNKNGVVGSFIGTA